MRSSAAISLISAALFSVAHGQSGMVNLTCGGKW